MVGRRKEGLKGTTSGYGNVGELQYFGNTLADLNKPSGICPGQYPNLTIPGRICIGIKFGDRTAIQRAHFGVASGYGNVGHFNSYVGLRRNWYLFSKKLNSRCSKI